MSRHHRHTCRCGHSVGCGWPVLRDDTGTYCEKEALVGPYECDDCRDARLAREDNDEELEPDTLSFVHTWRSDVWRSWSA